MRLKKNQFAANQADRSKRPRSRLQLLKSGAASPPLIEASPELPKSEDAALPPIEAGAELRYPNRLVAPPAWLGHTPFASWIVEALRPRTIVELGVHSGNSYCAFLQAVQALSLPTRCFGIDHWRGDEHAGTYGEEVYANLQAYHDPLYGAFSTLIRSSFQDALPYFSNASIDLLHIDGLHIYEAVHEDFASWLPKMSARGVVLLHDINVRDADFGVWQLWQEVAARYPNFEFVHSSGLGLAYVGREPPSKPLQMLFDSPSDATIARVRAYFARLGTSVLDRFSLATAQAELRSARVRLAHPIDEVELQKVRDEAKKANAQVAALQGELSAQQVDVARQLAAANTAAAAQQAESERAHAHIDRLNEELRAAQAEVVRQVETAARQLEAANVAAAAQQTESQRKHAYIGKLEEQLRAADAEHARHMEATARQLGTADAAAAAQQAESERKHVYIGQLEEQLRAAQGEHARHMEVTARQLGAADAAAAEHQAESERKHAYIGQLEEQLRTAHAEHARHIEATARELGAADAAAAAHEAESKRKDAYIGQLEAQVQAKVAELEQQLMIAQSDSENAKCKAAELEQEQAATQAKLAEAVSQHDSTSHILRQQTAVNSRLLRELVALQDSRTSQHLARLALARIHPNLKRAVPTRIKQYIKARMLG